MGYTESQINIFAGRSSRALYCRRLFILPRKSHPKFACIVNTEWLQQVLHLHTSVKLSRQLSILSIFIQAQFSHKMQVQTFILHQVLQFTKKVHEKFKVFSFVCLFFYFTSILSQLCVRAHSCRQLHLSQKSFLKMRIIKLSFT